MINNLIDISQLNNKPINLNLLSDNEIYLLANGNRRTYLLIQTIKKCGTYNKLSDFIKEWDFLIKQFEDVAFHQGIKEAEKVLKAGKGQPNVK